MENKQIERYTWFAANKLHDFLIMLTQLVDFNLDEVKFEEIKYKMIGSNDEKNQWAEFTLDERKLFIKLAFDDSDNNIIHISISSKEELKEKVEAIINKFSGI